MKKLFVMVCLGFFLVGCASIGSTQRETLFSPKASLFEGDYPVMWDCQSVHAQFNYEDGAIEKVSGDITSLVSIPQMVTSIMTVGTEGISSDQALEQGDCKTIPLKALYQDAGGTNEVVLTRDLGTIEMSSDKLSLSITGESKYKVSVTKK